MTASLDANVFVDMLKNRRGVRARFDAEVFAGHELKVSAVVLHEVMFGALSFARVPGLRVEGWRSA